MSTFLVAVVDDDQSVLESMEGLFQSAGYDVLLYESAEAFLTSGRLADIDCLLTDYGLPGMNGIDLLRAAHAIRANLPVILITARSEPELLRRALAAGAQHAFTKPGASADLLRAVASGK